MIVPAVRELIEASSGQEGASAAEITFRALTETDQFCDCAMGLINRHICISACAGVGVGDCDAAESLPPHYPWFLIFWPIRDRIKDSGPKA